MFASMLRPLPADARIARRLMRVASIVIAFVRDTSELEGGFCAWKRSLANDGALWICWRKRASGVVTDVGESSIRDYVLAHGLVDVKICAIDEMWSGLKFVYRLKDRVKSIAAGADRRR